jgi:hypothetical protein
MSERIRGWDEGGLTLSPRCRRTAMEALSPSRATMKSCWSLGLVVPCVWRITPMRADPDWVNWTICHSLRVSTSRRTCRARYGQHELRRDGDALSP